MTGVSIGGGVQQRRWEDGPGPVYYSSVPVVLRGPRPQHPHIYTISTQYLHSIYTVSIEYLQCTQNLGNVLCITYFLGAPVPKIFKCPLNCYALAVDQLL